MVWCGGGGGGDSGDSDDSDGKGCSRTAKQLVIEGLASHVAHEYLLNPKQMFSEILYTFFSSSMFAYTITRTFVSTRLSSHSVSKHSGFKELLECHAFHIVHLSKH